MAKKPKSRAASQRQYRCHQNVGVRQFRFFAEDGLVEFALRSVSGRLDHLPAGQSHTVIEAALADHLANEWLAGWKSEFVDFLSGLHEPPSSADSSSTGLWLWAD